MTADTLKAQRWTTFSWECGDEPPEDDMQHLSQKSVTLRNFTLVFSVDASPNGTVVSFSCPLFCSPSKEIPYCKAKRYLLIHKFDLNNWDRSWFGWTSVFLFTFPIFVFWASKNLHGCVLSCNCDRLIWLMLVLLHMAGWTGDLQRSLPANGSCWG